MTTCSCNQENADGNNTDGKPTSCGDGMTFDKDAGKCVKVGAKSKEQLGDPKTNSTQGE